MIEVLRLGHRPLRDKRITTHVGLVARAFGADGMIMTVQDEKVEESIKRVVENWGGRFYVKVVENWRDYIKNWKGKVVHLTMYGIPLDEKIGEIKKDSDILIIVGSQKVPGEVFDLADYNMAVGNQPHSEVSALAIFLDRFFEGTQLRREFKGKMKIIPSEKRKRIQKI
jgi:tRNA (cytidine56-2'-O)-methyltransferase